MSNILLFHGIHDPSSQMTRSFLAKFAKRYGCNLKCRLTKELSKSDIYWSDVVICHRGQTPFEAAILELARKSGRLAISSYDDDFLAITDYADRNPNGIKAINSIIINSQSLLTTNDNIGRRYKTINPKLKVIRTDTVVEKEEIYYRKKIAAIPPYKVAYYVNDGSTYEFESLIVPVIKKLGIDCKDFEWYFLGVKPSVDGLIDEQLVHFVPHMALLDFRKFLRTEDFAIGIAPLNDTKFNSAKYINKYLEFGTAGIPAIYSKVTPYVETVENMKDGILCDNHTESWSHAFETIKDYNLRKEIINTAQKKIINNFSIEGICNRIVDIEPAIISRQADGQFSYLYFDFSKLADKLLRTSDFFKRIVLRIKRKGFRNTIRYISDQYMKENRKSSNE